MEIQLKRNIKGQTMHEMLVGGGWAYIACSLARISAKRLFPHLKPMTYRSPKVDTVLLHQGSD